MNVLTVHQNFPGQYRHLATALVARGDRVVAIGGPTAQPLKGVTLHRYDPMPAGGVPPCHSWVGDIQTKVLRAEAVAAQIEALGRKGLDVDLVIGHPGWGELLAVKDVLPGVPVLHQLEFFYQLEGADAGFDPEFSQASWRSQAYGCGARPNSSPCKTWTGPLLPPAARPAPHRSLTAIGVA
jgi:hypothetical protein